MIMVHKLKDTRYNLVNIKERYFKLTPYLKQMKEVKREVCGEDWPWELEDKKRCDIAVQTDLSMVLMKIVFIIM